MAIPQPYNLDWTSIGECIVSVSGITWGFLGFTNKWFKDKAEARVASAKAEKEGKQEFIEKIVNATVTGTLNSVLGDIKEDIATLFKYRDEDSKSRQDDMKELNATVLKIYTELKK